MRDTSRESGLRASSKSHRSLASSLCGWGQSAAERARTVVCTAAAHTPHTVAGLAPGMTTPSMMIFLHRNDGTQVVDGAGKRLRVLLRPGVHTLEHVLDDATEALGLRTAATGLCRPDGTTIDGLDDLTPKADVVVLEGRKSFIPPGSKPEAARLKSPKRTASPGRSNGGVRRTPPRADGRRAPESHLSTSNTPDAPVPTHLTGAYRSAGDDSLRSEVDTPQERPRTRQLVRVRRGSSAREAALKRRGQRSSSNAKLAQLRENRRNYEAAKQAKLKRELAATREDLMASRDGGGEILGASAVEALPTLQTADPPSPTTQGRVLQRATENLAEPWTPPRRASTPTRRSRRRSSSE